MTVKPEKNIDASKEATINEPTEYYCLMLGSSYCKKECPNRCYDQFQKLIDKLFPKMDQAETD
ncbi:MAG: hypothetical protein GX808_08830 [Syntrophomonadaceae bacterium]|jgi:hypothetical protein|nr:hypothetical protein [Syntrophomonadaceae bacterium]